MNLRYKFKLKLAAIIFLILLAAAFILGCGGEDDGRVVFAVGGAPAEIDYWRTLADEFEMETGIELTIIRQPTDTDQRRQGLVTALNASSSDPDVFLMDVAWLAQIAASGWLEPLDHYSERDTLNPDIFFENIVEMADIYNDTLYALPVYVDGGLLYYRKDLLAKYDLEEPPQRWTEFVEVSKRVQIDMREDNPDFHGFVWQGAQYEGLICNFLEVAASNGGGLVNQEGQIEVNTEANIEALHMMRAMIADEKISPENTYTEFTEEEVRIYFQQGNALFERNWPYAWPLHQSPESEVKGKIGISALPHFEGGESISTLGGWHIGISKFSDNKEAAWEFVKFVVSAETQENLVINLGWNPGRIGLYLDPEIIEHMPHFPKLRLIFDNLHARPTLPYYSQLSTILQKHINSALSGAISPEKALSQAQNEIDQIVDRYE